MSGAYMPLEIRYNHGPPASARKAKHLDEADAKTLGPADAVPPAKTGL